MKVPFTEAEFAKFVIISFWTKFIAILGVMFVSYHFFRYFGLVATQNEFVPRSKYHLRIVGISLMAWGGISYFITIWWWKIVQKLFGFDGVVPAIELDEDYIPIWLIVGAVLLFASWSHGKATNIKKTKDEIKEEHAKTICANTLPGINKLSPNHS